MYITTSDIIGLHNPKIPLAPIHSWIPDKTLQLKFSATKYTLYKLRNIDFHNITHTVISWNPRERMLVVQISLLIVTFLSLISRISSLLQTTKEVNPHPCIAPCVNINVECLLLLLLLPLVECWCLHMPHRRGRPSRVDHTNGGERRMNPNFIVSHATLILYHATMLTLQNSVISRTLWLPQVWYYEV